METRENRNRHNKHNKHNKQYTCIVYDILFSFYFFTFVCYNEEQQYSRLPHTQLIRQKNSLC